MLDGAKIMKETWGDNVLTTLWDNEENICGIRYNDASYFFLKNLQGDIIAITDTNGDVVARYSYDAWGVPTIVSDTTAVGIATVNPFRYRGYYYDAETQLYYLQSRYYNPTIGRFVNADEAEILLTANEPILSNVFAYCVNNPASNSDQSGNWIARLIGGVAGAAIFGILAFVICKVVNMIVPIDNKVTTTITVACAALGGIIGAVLGPSFIAKHSPQLLKAIQQIEKTKFSAKTFGPNTAGNIFGIVISNILIIMLHAPHPKYNEWFFHIQVEVKLGAKQVQIYKKPIKNVDPKAWTHTWQNLLNKVLKIK